MRRLLVANRGEIALRVFRACGLLGIETVAVAAPDDAGALHARSADTTVAIASYLDAAEIVRAALESIPYQIACSSSPTSWPCRF